ncbi:unnamed protein product [Closterium sp. NIES-65]|nr:unnamed protein product [Closterium sp. NIES-65]
MCCPPLTASHLPPCLSFPPFPHRPLTSTHSLHPSLPRLSPPQLHRFLASAALHSLPVTSHHLSSLLSPFPSPSPLLSFTVSSQVQPATHCQSPSTGPLNTPLHRFLASAACHSLPVTFHRAFDHTRDPMAALQVLISSGVTRLLTSGQRATAEEGVGLIRKLVEEAQGRIHIMAGGGVSPENAASIVTQSGVSHIHASARSLAPQTEKIHLNDLCPFRATSMPPEGCLMQTNPRKVSAILLAIQPK